MRAPAVSLLLRAAVLISLFHLTSPWIVPQPKANVRRTLAQAMGQDHICLSQASAQNPMLSCLVGIPFKEEELPPTLLKLKNHYNDKAPGHIAHSFHSPKAYLPSLLRSTRAFIETGLERKIILPVFNPLGPLARLSCHPQSGN